MSASYVRRTHGVCSRYGPGRLPGANRPAIGAGYAAAAAAIAATVLFSIAFSAYSWVLGPGDWLASFLFPLYALLFVIPAAFLLASVGWAFVSPRSTLGGLVAGGLGALATYVLAGVLLSAVVVPITGTAIGVAALLDAIHFTIGVIGIALILTWWIAIPMGCLAGGVYANVVDC